MKYDSIPMVSMSNDDVTGLPLPETRSSFWPMSLISRNGIAALAVSLTIAMAVMFVATTQTHSSAQGAAMEPVLMSFSGVASCTFEECFNSNCNAEFAPYTCLLHNGGPHGGCSNIPWVEGTCEKQCDLSGCDALEIPDDTKDCDVACDKTWCAQGRLCGSDVQYQCTVGASAFGCSDDAYHWTLRTASTACSSCCNVNLC
jgi:hypothetical protein